jgi:hypothetical protein
MSSTEEAREQVVGRVLEQAASCRRSGSSLYGSLLERLAADVDEHGPGWAVLRDRASEDEDSALPLRLMAAVHRLVLLGRAPELAAHYPSVGGTSGPNGAWPAFRSLLDDHAQWLRRELERPCQTNEVGRSAALVGGFLVVARDTGLPLRHLEIGASAGLNLLWDRYLYEARGATWGDEGSPVRLCDFNTQRVPPFDVAATVRSRSGCDRNPLNPAQEQDRVTLRSFVWADQVGRLRLLDAALRVAADTPVTVERADATEWLVRKLRRSHEGVATVVTHSIVLPYLEAAGRDRLLAELHRAGAQATTAAPLAWLRMEPAGERAEVRLTSWPGAHERLLARSGYHGNAVEWLG